MIEYLVECKFSTYWEAYSGQIVFLWEREIGLPREKPKGRIDSVLCLISSGDNRHVCENFEVTNIRGNAKNRTNNVVLSSLFHVCEMTRDVDETSSRHLNRVWLKQLIAWQNVEYIDFLSLWRWTGRSWPRYWIWLKAGTKKGLIFCTEEQSMVTKASLFNRPFSQMFRTTCELQKRRFVANESYVPHSSQSDAKCGVTHCLGRWHFHVDVPGSNPARAGFVFIDHDLIPSRFVNNQLCVSCQSSLMC